MAETAVTLGRRLIQKREKLDAAERAAKAAKDEHDQAQAALWDKMDDEKRTTDTLDLGEPYGKVQFQKRETIRGNILDKTRAIQAIKDEHLDDSLLEAFTIRRKPLNDLIKARLRSQQPLPNGVDFSTTRYVTISRRKES